MPRDWKPRYTDVQVRDAVAGATSISGALRTLGLRVAGDNHKTLKRLIAHYAISTEHFDPYRAPRRGTGRSGSIPLESVLVEHSTYSRGNLKRRLLKEGLKEPHCELCGQDENWRGEWMSLILDHINGAAEDNRLENLRILCPNCNATLDTHCGRQMRTERVPQECLRCGAEFIPNRAGQRYCSPECGVLRSSGARPGATKAAPSSGNGLLRRIATLSRWAVARDSEPAVSARGITIVRTMRLVPRHPRSAVEAAVENAHSVTDVVRSLGLRIGSGHIHRSTRSLIEFYEISTEHFDPYWGQRRGKGSGGRTPLEAVLVEHSTYHRAKLKQRLYYAGLKQRCCEMCGQGESWRGDQMSLILDHINGVADDNRIENLRIVCPNCNATLETHCGRKVRADWTPRDCLFCGRRFVPKIRAQRYCSRNCGIHSPGPRGPKPEIRKVERPSHEQLLKDVASMSMCAVGRKYGVSDNAVRKWLRWYEAASEASSNGLGSARP